MSELVSMKMTATERKDQYGPTLANGEPEGPVYPYGLSVELRDEALDKVGLKLPKVGTVLTLIARVEVTNVSSNQGPDKQKRESVSLQITDLCLEPESAAASIEDALYKS